MKKMFLPMLALVAAISFSAFTHRSFDSKQWHFKSNMTLQDARNPGSYESNFGAVTCEGTDLPCIIEVPHINGNTDEQDLAAYLSGFSTDQAVVDDAVERRD